MRLTITIDLPNKESDDGWKHDEAARILRRAADKIEAGAWTHELTETDGVQRPVGWAFVDHELGNS